jgi:hypothetical protein
MACRDENPLMIYQEVCYRLRFFPGTYNVQDIVRSRPDLFRPGVPEWRLDDWKKDRKADKHLPSWIKEADASKKDSLIDALTTQDVFRSQFRPTAKEDKSTLEEISWGLLHIDRLRKATLEQRTQTAKSWQIWLVFLVGAANVVLTVLNLLLAGPH